MILGTEDVHCTPDLGFDILHSSTNEYFLSVDLNKDSMAKQSFIMTYHAYFTIFNPQTACMIMNTMGLVS